MPTKDFEAKYNKVKAKLALLISSALASKAATVKNKGLIVEAYEWDKEKVSSDDNEMVEVKVLMALVEENDAISKEGARNGESVKISMRKVHTLLEMEDNDDRKPYLDYLCINLNYVKEQRNNLLSKHRDLVHELNACKEQLLVLKQAKLDFLTMQHKRILGVDQLTKDQSSSGKIDLVFVKSSADDTKVSIPSVERPWLSETKGFILPNYDTGRILPAESQRNTTDPLVAVIDFSATKYDSVDESSVCSTLLPPLKKLDGVEPIFGPKNIKSILRSKSAFKAKTLKGFTINEPSSASAKGNKSSLASKVNSSPAGKLNSVKIKDDPPLAICERTDYRTYDHAEYISTKNMSQHLKSLGRSSSRPKNLRPSKHFFPPCIHCGFNDHLYDDCVNYPICDICGSYDHDTHGHNRIISLRRGIKHRNPQRVMKSCETCGITFHTTTDHNDIEWFRNGEELQAKKCDIRKPIWYLESGCSRHMTGVKNYLHKYVEQPGPKVVFGDDSTCTTKGYGSIKCNGIVFTKVAFVNGLKYNLISISQLYDAKYIVQFNEKRGTIFNSKKEVVMIALRVRDLYVLDMTSSTQESCFFVKVFENLNWLWHKRLADLNFKKINKLAKQNLVIGLPSLVYSKDKPCLSCEKGKHHRASFKTKQTSSIKKCIHLLHMDLFRLVTPRYINHEKYTLIIVDEYSRYTCVYFLKKKSQAPETIMSFIKRVKNQNDIKFKQLRFDNGTEFRNSTLVNFYDEKGISQNFSSPYTPKQNSVVERKNRTLIEVARKMLSRYVFSKLYWTEAAFRVFNTRRQRTKETYHITLDEIPDAIKFLKPLVDNINIAENERYPPDEYLHPYEPSQRYQTNSNDVSFMEPYECPEPVVLKTKVSSDQNDHNDQNDQSVQNDEILSIQISEHSSSPRVEDTSVHNTIPIPNSSLSIPSMVTPAPQDRWSQDKHIELVNIIGNPEAGMLTRAMAKELGAVSAHECLFVDFLSKEEPKKVSEALQHLGWVDAMQDELNQFARNKVWALVLAPYGKTIISLKWVFKNKRDETGIVIKNKRRLIAQGYNQQESIDYDETFPLVARLKAIRIFISIATYMNFLVCQMDVKSTFLIGKLKEKVYVKPPLGLESNEFLSHFVRGKIDNTLFVYKTQTDVILVQIYVDDIIFGSTSTKLCKQFAKLMTQRYEMSMMGVLTYFLGFQIKQSERGISINQEKYVKDLLKKYDINGSSVKTPMVPPNKLGPDLNGKAVNETQYRGMIGSLMYLTASRLNIQFSTCLYARYQANPKESHLIAVKRIFRYLKGTPSLGLWYPKCSGACQLLGGKLVCWSAKKQQSVAMSSAEPEYLAAAGCCVNILWVKSQLTDYDIIYEKVPIFCDNTSAIAISNNPFLHSRTKHIDIRYHFIRDLILKGDIELYFIPTQYQLADIFTKPLDEPTFKRLIVELDQIEFSFDEIAFTTNNEVALLYPSHLNSEYFREVSDFISKYCPKEAFTRAPTQYKEYLCKFWYTAKTLNDSKICVSTLIGGIRGDICYSGEIGAKGTLKKSCLLTNGSDHSVFRWENRWPGSNIKQGCHHVVLSGKWGEGRLY
ncbi:retrovirus-related pol polyprotein from transposon TNT 1-94 [Tanacetum coccineum]